MQTRSKKPSTRLQKARKMTKADNPSQSAAFIEKARELEADGEDSKADLLMGRLAKMKPAPRSKKPKPQKH
jgi:hypothetical protein